MGIVAAAEERWHGGSGVFEPSTSYDTDQYMWQTGNPTAVDKVYFNGFVVESRFPSSVVQLDGGSVMGQSADMYFGAMLGYWRDCNKDDYIGDKNVPASYGNWVSGAYPADATSVDNPVDESICPVGSPYNNGAIVDEFRWIGPNAAPTAPKNGCPVVVFNCWDADVNDVTDSKAIVWADRGEPEAVNDGAELLLSRGTLSDSHSTLARALRIAGVENRVPYEDTPNVGACGEGDREFLGGPDGQCGLYPLWQAKRLVNDSDSREEPTTPIVAVYDTENDDDGSGNPCDDTEVPNDGRMADVNPSVVDDPLMEGSIGGTLVNIRTGSGNLAFDGECGAYASPNLEGRAGEPAKVIVDADLEFQRDKRFNGLGTVGMGGVPMDTFGLTGGPHGPWDSPYAGLSGGAKWLSYPHFAVTPPVGAPMWTTMYADLTAESVGASAATALPAGVQDAHTYGAFQCGGDFSDSPGNREANVYNWICSETMWEDARNADSGGSWRKLIIGQSFDLRDVDCYDLTLAEVHGTDTDADGTRITPPAIDAEGPDGGPIRSVCG